MRLRTDDEVIVISGKDKGKTGKIIRVDPKKERIYVEGLNIVKRHQRPTPGRPKTRQGVVVSAKGDKTITVRIDVVQRHRRYRKILRHTVKLHAHDERNVAAEGDTVRIVECRPMSRTKRWRLTDVLERAR